MPAFRTLLCPLASCNKQQTDTRRICTILEVQSSYSKFSQEGQVTWTHSTSPTCDLCNAGDVQDEQHVLFHCIHPHVVSLQRAYASLFSSAGLNNVSAFLGQENNKLYFFLHALMVFMSRLAVALLD